MFSFNGGNKTKLKEYDDTRTPRTKRVSMSLSYRFLVVANTQNIKSGLTINSPKINFFPNSFRCVISKKNFVLTKRFILSSHSNEVVKTSNNHA
ncbi:CLUMA_CG005221, isoform A [Clunio marinus]|uniref:CLUMA_CG005221, isoform A n=1 Tax=Clunio marinus TaxID=568069 RepID=A0A1J1HYF6_9DIPT|nr:CLUMA_CG005221, isoform A [Clunio marinus]